MHDILVVGLFVSMCGAIGLPFSLLLPSQRFAVRWALAPPLGFGLLAAATAILYLSGVAPWVTLLAMAAAGLVVAAAMMVRVGQWRRRISAGAWPAMAIVAVVAILCLAPGWTGGPRFRVFQANVYDQLLYVGASISYRTLDYATLVVQGVEGTQSDPLAVAALWFIDWRSAVSMMHAAFAGVSRGHVVDCTYPYMVGMQLNMLFAALFVFVNALAMRRWPAWICASALTVGFFEQYVFDINAWSQLAAQPIFLLLLAFVALAFDKDRFGQVPGSIVRLGAIFAALMTGVFFLYPESLTVYGLAAMVIVVMAIGHRTSRQALPVAATGLAAGIGASLLACIPHWSGTAAYVVRQLSHAAAYPPDWWKYFQLYLFGGEANFLEIIAGPDSRLGELANAYFSLPVEAAVAGLGLYAVLPSAGWPVAIAFVWKLLLYGFLFVLVRSVAGAVWTIWRSEPDGSAARLLAGSLAGCLVPIAILAAGHAWAAGKGLAMAAPMLFTLIVAPLVAAQWRSSAVVASIIVVVAHLILGALRPLLVLQALGAGIPGLPTSAAQVNAQKASLDWDYNRLSAEFGSCNGIVIDVAHPMMNHVLRSLAADHGIAWASPNVFMWSGKTGRAYLPTGWDKFDCLASADRLTANPGQRLVSVATDRSSREFLEGRRDVLEIGVEVPPGIATRGLFGKESTPGGALRWASPAAYFDVPNKPSAPARTLRLALWPMPISGSEFLVKINGREIYRGSVPAGPLSFPLDELAGEETLTVELATNSVTRFPGDPRDLGFAIRELSVRR
ncbi:hypothetical protein [Bradyrhizobium sp. TM239]|uniref:hypothetical protein n=1 Tax=Bradyrhizobium sp. TM239 TaxID=2599802 RepID=UPI0027D53C0A|nr:hypothetical protein TM239_42820 [Bradyrhizobium sp. TM239]